MHDELKERMTRAIDAIINWPSNLINLFHHNDTDGLTSAAILKKALEREGYTIKTISLEKPYPAVLKRIFEMKGQIIIFADFAGRIAPIISDLNNNKNLVVILDHHVAEPSTSELVINCDPDLFGLKGDRDISASTTCYLFATTLNTNNRELAWIGSLGAVGDEFFVDGELVGENLNVTEEAVKQGKVRIDHNKKGGYRYIFITEKGEVSGYWFMEYLDTLGGVGFYQNGPSVGIDVCLNGFSEHSDKMVERLKKVKDDIFAKEIEKLKNGALVQTPNIQWFHVQNRFSPMGVKMIGVFCDTIKKLDFINPEKYIAGFQLIPNEVPGFGKIEINQVKISMRVPISMENAIREKKKIGLDILLPEATKKLGGFSDACHSLTAATTISIGKESLLIDEMEKILKES